MCRLLPRDQPQRQLSCREAPRAPGSGSQRFREEGDLSGTRGRAGEALVLDGGPCRSSRLQQAGPSAFDPLWGHAG